jgi:O-antigen ligase
MSPKHKRRAPRAATAGSTVGSQAPSRIRNHHSPSTRPAAWEWPLLAALALAPLVGGMLVGGSTTGVGVTWLAAFPPVAGLADVPASVWVALLQELIWAALILRLLLPGWRREPLPATLAGRLLGGFVTLAGLSMVTSVYRGASLTAVAQYAAWLAAFALAADLARRPGGAARLLAAVLGGASLAAVIGLRQTLENGLRGSWYWRAFGTFVQPNLFASCLLFALPLALSFYLRGRGRAAFAAGGAALLLLCELMFTGSRGAVYTLPLVLLLFIALAAWLGLLRSRESWARFGLLLALGGIVASLSTSSLRARNVAFGEATVPDLLCGQQQVGGTSESNAFRRLTWSATLRMARERPLFGFGAGTFVYAYPRYAVAGFTRTAHESYLQHAAEAGIPAALVWVAALAAAFWALLRARQAPEVAWWAPGVAAALAASAAHNLIDYSWYVAGTALPFWSLLGLAAGARGTGVDSADEHRSAQAGRESPLRRIWLVLAVPWIWIGAAAGMASYLLGEAMAARSRGGTYVVRTLLQQGVSAAPWDADLRSELALANEQLGDEAAALAGQERAIAMAPTYSVLRYRLGRTRERLGDTAGAVFAYRRAADLNPQETQAQLAIAEALERAGDRSGALAAYRRLVEIEQSPAGRVRAISELRDYRFSLAHQKLGDAALGARDSAAARQEYLAAACGIAAMREEMENVGTYLEGLGLPSPPRLRELGESELQMWNWLAADFARTGDAARAAAAREMAAKASRRRQGEGS